MDDRRRMVDETQNEACKLRSSQSSRSFYARIARNCRAPRAALGGNLRCRKGKSVHFDGKQSSFRIVSFDKRSPQEVSLMWEGRVRNLLISLGVVSNLAKTTKPIKAIGLELSYFSSE